MKVMKKLYIILLLSISVLSIFSQKIEFENESGKHPYIDDKLEKIINEQFLDTKYNCEFEFRFYTIPSLIINGESVFVMRLKASKWEACFFQKDRKGRWFANDLRVDGVAELWKNLEKHKALTLPDDSEIERFKKGFSTDTLMVFSKDAWDSYKVSKIMDGVGYQFELKQGAYKKRVYSYHCPKAYLKIYPNIEELYNAYSIILHIQKFLGLSLSGVC